MKKTIENKDKWIRKYADKIKKNNPEAPSEYGNIDLNNRPVHRNSDGSISTVRSMSFNEDGKEILIPTVRDENHIMSDNEAIDHYHRTGQHLGKFNTVEGANRYAEWLHNDQAKKYGKAELRKDVQRQPIWRSSTPEQREIQNKVIRPADRGKMESDPTQGWGSKLNMETRYGSLMSQDRYEKMREGSKPKKVMPDAETRDEITDRVPTPTIQRRRSMLPSRQEIKTQGMDKMSNEQKEINSKNWVKAYKKETNKRSK